MDTLCTEGLLLFLMHSQGTGGDKSEAVGQGVTVPGSYCPPGTYDAMAILGLGALGGRSYGESCEWHWESFTCGGKRGVDKTKGKAINVSLKDTEESGIAEICQEKMQM